jgi:hypothetical protein
MPEPNTYTVFLYNATNEEIDFMVNQGPLIAVPAASPPNYAPATPAGRNPQIVEAVLPSMPGQFFLGLNNMSFNISGGPGPIPARLDLSNIAGIMINSCALYLFAKSMQTVSWLFLVNGQPVAGSLGL